MSESVQHPSPDEFEYICDICREEHGKRHKRNHRISSSESCYECKVCKKSFSMGFVTRKLKLTRKESYSCENCKKKFRTKSGLKYHSFTHSYNWPCWCSFCKKGFANKAFLEQHMRRHSDNVMFECDFCLLKFKSRIGLSEHRLIHTGKYKWKCEECSKGFLFESKLKLHMRTHRDFQCSVCSFSTKFKYDLENHNQIHDEKYKFKCELCSKVFTSESHLKSHLRSHDESWDFQCNVCDVTFKSKYPLDRHSITQKRQHKWKCRVCWREFAYEQNMRKHMGTHSGVQVLKTGDFLGNCREPVDDPEKHLLKCNLCYCKSYSESLLEEHKEICHHTSQLNSDGMPNLFVANSEEVVDDCYSENTAKELLECDLCGYKCFSKPLLEEHKQICHQTSRTNSDGISYLSSANSAEAGDYPTSEKIDKQLLKCDFCNCECDSELLLRQHKQIHHQTSQTNSDGNSCLFIINSSETRDDCNSENTEKQLFKCDLCSNECDSELLLGQHKQIYHQNNSAGMPYLALENDNSF
ncbi:hypothetical protein NPIL_522061 [Nephila pilipes]|uniref:C2H2-type domain-containing protein n=1 Tax=Nephila pilipes TaxID=299642 RepID=A0A8X6UE73_NEPPI|nr:hypothetical protein NPIL_522061 [Nephila pilipes]